MAPHSEVYSFDTNNHLIEFKPRVGTWACYDIWSQPKLQIGDTTSSSSSSSLTEGLRQRRRRKTVKFARQQEKDTQEYMHVNDYTMEEKQACWYKRPEYQAMKQHNAETIDKITQSIPLSSQEESHFGLELRTPRENLRCHHLIRLALLTVLDEQDDQWRFDGYLNDEVIAARYMSCTWEARDIAHCLGQSHRLMVC